MWVREALTLGYSGIYAKCMCSIKAVVVLCNDIAPLLQEPTLHCETFLQIIKQPLRDSLFYINFIEVDTLVVNIFVCVH